MADAPVVSGRADPAFSPRIVGFLCNWCTYAAADMAGAARLSLPDGFTAVRVMCSSRVDPNLVLTTLFNGADGVLIAGCHPGDCHYEKGNYFTRRRYAMIRRVLEVLHLEPDRVRLAWISASEGRRYAAVVNEFTGDIQRLGPCGIGRFPVETDV